MRNSQTLVGPLLAVPLLAAVLSLAGCKFESGGITTITNTSIDGDAINTTRALIVDGHGEFDCVKSATGQCHYVLFVQRCAGDADASSHASVAPEAMHARSCETRVVRTFSLRSGASKLLGGLPAHVKMCVSHALEPVAPGCMQRAG